MQENVLSIININEIAKLMCKVNHQNDVLGNIFIISIIKACCFWMMYVLKILHPVSKMENVKYYFRQKVFGIFLQTTQNK